ncbi:hypothetical protein BELL_1116g00010 [Botrytis elliptica]|uniref:Uncharacterized protein n=1 Tax=Botrytis elliptica TaxID=278938 RepID=A0A4Z1IZU8_9HELO|nr:hypothetical protein BELL_1116g00010 [Botrytis elliptica]
MAPLPDHNKKDISDLFKSLCKSLIFNPSYKLKHPSESISFPICDCETTIPDNSKMNSFDFLLVVDSSPVDSDPSLSTPQPSELLMAQPQPQPQPQSQSQSNPNPNPNPRLGSLPPKTKTESRPRPPPKPYSQLSPKPSSSPSSSLSTSTSSFENDIELSDTTLTPSSFDSTPLAHLQCTKESSQANIHHHHPGFFPLAQKHLKDLYIRTRSRCYSESTQTRIRMSKLNEDINSRNDNPRYWAEDIANNFALTHRVLSQVLYMKGSTQQIENISGLSTFSKWKVLSLFENPQSQCLGCIAFVNVDTDMGNATANIDNTNRNNIDTSSTLLRVELFCLFILLARQIDPRLNCKNYRQLIRDADKGNGWVTRSAVTIFLTKTHFRVVEARLNEGTWDQTVPVEICIHIRKSIRWDEVDLKDEKHNEEVWRELVSWSFLLAENSRDN